METKAEKENFALRSLAIGLVVIFIGLMVANNFESDTVILIGRIIECIGALTLLVCICVIANYVWEEFKDNGDPEQLSLDERRQKNTLKEIRKNNNDIRNDENWNWNDIDNKI